MRKRTAVLTFTVVPTGVLAGNPRAEQDRKPLIVVCPTYNNTSPQDSADFGLALTLNQNYHHELLGDLIPAVESRYSNYAKNVSPEGLKAARDHRGFGGFSMGAVATWRTFQNGLRLRSPLRPGPSRAPAKLPNLHRSPHRAGRELRVLRQGRVLPQRVALVLEPVTADFIINYGIRID
jgi:hypothetical protein